MTDILEFMGERQDWISERYHLVRERMEELIHDDKELFRREFLSELALFLVDCMRVYDLGEAQIMESLPEEKRHEILNQLTWRAEKLRGRTEAENKSLNWSGLFQVFVELYMPCAAYCMRREQLLLTIHAELFVQVYQIFQIWSAGEETEEQAYAAMKEAVYYHLRDYCDVMLAYNQRDLCRLIIMEQGAEGGGAAGSHLEALTGGIISERIRRYREQLLSMNQEEYLSAVKNSISCDCIYRRLIKADTGGLSVYDIHADTSELPVYDIYTGGGYVTLILVIGGLESYAFSVGQHLMDCGRSVRYAGFRDTVWNRMILDCGESEASLFFDRGFCDRIYSEEKNALERSKEILMRLEAVIIPGWSEYEKNPMQSDRKITEKSPIQSDRTVSDKNLKRYRKYVSEVRELHETFAFSIDGKFYAEV